MRRRRGAGPAGAAEAGSTPEADAARSGAPGEGQPQILGERPVAGPTSGADPLDGAGATPGPGAGATPGPAAGATPGSGAGAPLPTDAPAGGPRPGDPPPLPLSPAAAQASAARPRLQDRGAERADGDPCVTLHASCVAVETATRGDSAQGIVAALILGPSGSGKSSLALELISRGARLVADDRCRVRAGAQGLSASAPVALAGLIEARGVVLLALPPLAEARLVVAVDLSAPEPERLPPPRRLALLGVELPLVLSPSAPALFGLLLAGGRRRAP